MVLTAATTGTTHHNDDNWLGFLGVQCFVRLLYSVFAGSSPSNFSRLLLLVCLSLMQYKSQTLNIRIEETFNKLLWEHQ